LYPLKGYTAQKVLKEFPSKVERSGAFGSCLNTKTR